MSQSVVSVSGLADLPPGPELCAVLAGVDPTLVANGDIVAVPRAWARQRAHVDARFLAVVAEVGRRDPLAELESVGRLQVPGRYAADETRAALAWTRRAAEAEHDFAEVLTARLPLVFAALEAGEIDRPRARVFAEHLADLPASDSEMICRRLVPKAGRLTTGQLRVRLARMVIATDPGHARDQYEKAVAQRCVVGYLNRDGTAVIAAEGLPVEEAASAGDRLDGLARAAKRAGHPGRLDQIRADVFLGLLDGRLHNLNRDQIIDALVKSFGDDPGGVSDDAPARADTGPGARGVGRHRREPAGDPAASRVATGVEIRAELSTLLGHDEHPGEIPGWGPVPAHVARRVVAGQRAAEWRFAVTDGEGYLACGGITRRRPAGATPARRGGVVELHVPATVLAALAANPPAEWANVISDIAAQYARWPGVLRRLDDRAGRRFPTAALRWHVQILSRTCGGIGCRRSASRSQFDHTRDYRHGGPTSRTNSDMLCNHDHDLKSKGGWKLEQPEPGHLIWTSPLGQTYRTRGDPIIFPLPTAPPGDDPPPY